MGMMIKEKFYELLKSQGFSSLREFARATNIGVGNIYSNINGTFRLSIERAFVFANTLGVPIDTILGIFYEQEMSENYKAVKCK